MMNLMRKWESNPEKLPKFDALIRSKSDVEATDDADVKDNLIPLKRLLFEFHCVTISFVLK